MNVLFGVTGGVAVYKSLNVIRMLIKAGHEVKVIMTPNATKFINPILFKTLSNNEVFTEDFDYRYPLAHIKLSDWADVFVIAPATANTIAKIAHGVADNLLTSNFLAFNKRKLIFPAMNVHMLENPITQDNISRLRSLPGHEIFDPESGELACGYSAKGRLPSEEVIFGMIDRDPALPLKDTRYIVTAGGTIEPIDPVRYISNHSSGKMGIEIAKSLFRKGADVLLVAGSVSEKLPPYIPSTRVYSTTEMLATVNSNMPQCDGLFMAAAPADFRVKNISASKIKKGSAPALELELNPDILESVTSAHPGKLYVGFALETDDFEKHALDKLHRKRLDYIALNPLTPEFQPMGGDMNRLILFSKDGTRLETSLATKREIANWLVETILPGDASE